MTAVVLEASRRVDVPPEEAWSVVGDPDAYHRYVGDLRSTEVVEGSGDGMRRRCENAAGQTWEETCTLWEPGRRYRFEVDVDTYPRSLRALFSSFAGTWSVEPEGGGARISLRFEGETRMGVVGRGLVSAMARRAGLDVILDRYAAELG